MEEPSVLDYLKAKLMPWRGPVPQIPVTDSVQAEAGGTVIASDLGQGQVEGPPSAAHAVSSAEAIPTPVARDVALPWLSLLSFTFALLAQISLEPGPDRGWGMGALLYSFSALCLVVTIWRGELAAAELPEMEYREDLLTGRISGLLVALPLMVLAFLSFSENRFTTLNVVLWLLSLAAVIWGFWLPDAAAQSWVKWLRVAISQREWKITLTPTVLVSLAAIALILFFRLYQLNQVPPEMFSDHAEKLLDVWDVLHGETRIFFPRNTGREALQMYMTAATIQLLGTGYSHLSLKIGSVLAGLLTLPFIYLLGKDMGSRRVGFLAALLAGIAYWPNVISRVGLRFPLYPLFVAPTLYFLLRGIRTSNRNDFILSGLFLGIGLHGYTPIRILPFVVLAAVGVFLLHRQSRGVRRQTLFFLVILALISLVVFLPLLRYAVDNPGGFSFRSFSRVGSIERPLPGPAGQIFLDNLWNALTMFTWDNGGIWVVSVANRPALDVVSGALFFSGVVLLILRYLRRRHWLDLFILLSLLLLLMPSILSLAYPEENPALNRTAGAIVPVFLIIAISLDGLMSAIEKKAGQWAGSRLAWGIAVVLILIASLQNYNLVFDEYARVYRMSSWNTSEMGKVIQQFTASVGSPDTAWVVAYPHWVDTRLVGMNAGYTLKDYAIWPDQLVETTAERRAKLFLVKPEDTQGLETLKDLYPEGVLQEYVSSVENHNFVMVFVPPQP